MLLKPFVSAFLLSMATVATAPVSTAKQKWTKGQLKILPLWVWCDWGIGVRQHLGSRAFRIAGGCPDALAR